MGLSCGMSMIKYILFIFNVICGLLGGALLAAGIVVLVKASEVSDVFKNSNVSAPPIIFIVLGSIILIISFFGCCGAIRESHCMVMTYASILMLLIVAQLVIGIFIFVAADDARKASLDLLTSLWNRDGQINTEFTNAIQSNLECCGLDGSLEWGIAPPPSCCKPGTPLCTVGFTFSQGCRQALQEFMDNAAVTLGSIAIGFAVVQFVGFIFACCLGNSIRNQERRYHVLSLLLQAILFLAAGIFITCVTDVVTEEFSLLATEMWKHSKVTDRKTIDVMQRSLKCCGYESILEFGLTPPTTCCEPNSLICTVGFTYSQACGPAFKGIVKQSLTVIGLVTFGLAGFYVIASIVTFCLRYFKDEETKPNRPAISFKQLPYNNV